MKRNNTIQKKLNKVIKGYNDLLLDEIRYAVEMARQYPNTPSSEIIGYGQERAKRVLTMKDAVIAKILK